MTEADREAEAAGGPRSLAPSGERRGFATAPDGTRLFYRHSSRTPGPVHAVLSDGILCDGFIWKYLWDELGGLLPVTHWHYPGHGRSARPSDESKVDIASLAVDLHEVARETGDADRVLFGHSMGVQVALEGYHQRPDRVRGLVLFCGSFGKVTSSFRGVPILDVLLPKLTEIAAKQPDIVRALWSRIPADMAMKMARKAGDVDAAKIRDEDMLPYLQHMTHVDFPLFLRMLKGAGEHTSEDYLRRSTCRSWWSPERRTPSRPLGSPSTWRGGCPRRSSWCSPPARTRRRSSSPTWSSVTSASSSRGSGSDPP